MHFFSVFYSSLVHKFYVFGWQNNQIFVVKLIFAIFRKFSDMKEIIW